MPSIDTEEREQEACRTTMHGDRVTPGQNDTTSVVDEARICRLTLVVVVATLLRWDMERGALGEQLIQLGLNSYEARAYLALISRESSTPVEVARLSGVPRQRIYDVLGTLVQRGLASARPGATTKYAGTEPRFVIDQLVATRRQQMAEIEEHARGMAEELSAVYQAGRERADPLDYIEVLRDRGTIGARFEELEASVQKEILVFTKPPYAIDPQNNVQGLMVARTSDARSLYECSLFDDLAATEGVRRFIQAGEQARVVAELPMKLVIIDERVSMLGLLDPLPESQEFTILVVQHASLARVLKAAFNTYWEQGLAFDDAYARYMRGQEEGSCGGE
jgi:hypothetical protein